MTPEEQFRMLRSDDVWPVDVRVETVTASRGPRVWPVVWRTVAGVAAVAAMIGGIYSVTALRDARAGHSGPAHVMTPISTSTASSLPSCAAGDLHVAMLDFDRVDPEAWIFATNGDCAVNASDVGLRAFGDGAIDGLVAHVNQKPRPLDRQIAITDAGSLLTFGASVGDCSDGTVERGATLPWSLWWNGTSIPLGAHPTSTSAPGCVMLSPSAALAVQADTELLSSPVSGQRPAVAATDLRAELREDLGHESRSADARVSIDADGQGITAVVDRMPGAALIATWRERAADGSLAIRFIVAPLSDACTSAMAPTLSEAGLAASLAGGFDDPSGMAIHWFATDEIDSREAAQLAKILSEVCPGIAFDVAVDEGFSQNDLLGPPAVSSATPTP